MTGLVETAQRWAEADPDPDTRREVANLVASGDIAGLEERFSTALTFGTAGIRGPVGAGPGRMNRAVVIRTTFGLASYFPQGTVILGFDARPTSRMFAEDTAGVLAAAGFDVLYFPEPTPTPLVAYAARIHAAVAAVVITASHNPPGDNGYKVYGGNAAQIVPPVDGGVEQLIRSAPLASDVPRLEDTFSETSSRVRKVPSDTVDRYVEEVEGIRPAPTRSDLRIVYTPIHGVAGELVTRLVTAGGHPNLVSVIEQFEPDGTFPTVDFPNPEEPGALNLAIRTARREQADLILANDPDGDRLAVALPRAGEWWTLNGNDLGCLLADLVITHHSGEERPIVISSIVSSPMLTRLAGARDARHISTLTGFKWIVNAGLSLEAAGEGRFVFGYEEALGYTIGTVVRDKDGMSAALVFCDLVASLRARSETVWDRLTALWRETGVWASGQHSVSGGAAVLSEAVDRLGSFPPTEVAGMPVTDITDYRKDADGRPFWLGAQNLIELSLGDQGRVLVRPSGTEPKLKIYVDLTEPAGSDPMQQQADLAKRATEVGAGMAGVIGL